MNLLPLFFAALGAVALVATLYGLWRSVRAALGGADDRVLRSARRSLHRAALLDEKRALLQSIRDLRFERDIGKISEEDFEALDRSLRARIRDVFRSLDQDAEPFRKEADELIRTRLEKELPAS